MDEVVNIIISVIIAASAVAFGIVRSRKKSAAPVNTMTPKPSRSQEMQQKVMEWRKNNSGNSTAAMPAPRNEAKRETNADKKATTANSQHHPLREQRKPSASYNEEPIAAKFNLRDAILYSEIMKPKFDE